MLATVLWEHGSFCLYSTLPMMWLTCELLLTLSPKLPTGLPKITTRGVMIIWNNAQPVFFFTVQFFCTNLRAERHSSNHDVKAEVCLTKYILKLLGLGSKNRKNIREHIEKMGIILIHLNIIIHIFMYFMDWHILFPTSCIILYYPSPLGLSYFSGKKIFSCNNTLQKHCCFHSWKVYLITNKYK